MTDRQQLLSLLTGNPDLVSRLLVCAEGADPADPVAGAESAYGHLAPLVAGKSREHFAVLALDRRRRVIASTVLTVGNDGFCIVDPRQVYSWALRQGKMGAHAIIVAHNHPSGATRPSRQDIDVTETLAQAGRMLGVPLLDHLVIGGTGYTSLAEEGYISPGSI
jgi:DNA repair protein RadC